MEVNLRNGFCELTMDEMQVVDGGSKEVAQAIFMVGGIAMVALGAPVAGFVGGAAAYATACVSGMGLVTNGLFL